MLNATVPSIIVSDESEECAYFQGCNYKVNFLYPYSFIPAPIDNLENPNVIQPFPFDDHKDNTLIFQTESSDDSYLPDDYHEVMQDSECSYDDSTDSSSEEEENNAPINSNVKTIKYSFGSSGSVLKVVNNLHEKVSSFIEMHRDFFIASIKGDLDIWVEKTLTELEKKSLFEFSKKLLDRLEVSHDVRDDAEWRRFKPMPIACFVDGINGLKDESDGRDPDTLATREDVLLQFLKQNQHVTNFLAAEFKNIMEIINHWEQQQKLEQICDQIFENKNFITTLMHDGFVCWMENNLLSTQQQDLILAMSNGLIKSDSFYDLANVLELTDTDCKNGILVILKEDGDLAQVFMQYLAMSEIKDIMAAWKLVEQQMTNSETDIESVGSDMEIINSPKEFEQSMQQPSAAVLANSMKPVFTNPNPNKRSPESAEHILEKEDTKKLKLSEEYSQQQNTFNYGQ